MSDTSQPTRPASPLKAMLRRWPISLACALIGALLGVMLANLSPAIHTAEARLAVAPDSNNAYAIAGFPTASRELAANYSRWVQNNATAGEWQVAGVKSVTASPIPESGVIRIEATSADPDAAVAGAREISEQLRKVVSEAQVNRDPQGAYRRYAELAPRVSTAQSALERAQSAYGRSPTAANASAVERARTALSLISLEHDAQGELYKRLTSDTLAISQLEEIVPAARVGDDKASKVQLYGLFGVAMGLFSALLLSSLLERRRPSAVRSRATTGTTNSAPVGTASTGLSSTTTATPVGRTDAAAPDSTQQTRPTAGATTP